MSSNTIRSIKIDIKNKKVFIASASNNVYPKDYSRSHLPFYDKFFNEVDGVEKIQKHILFTFFSGESKGLSTTYGKAMASFKCEGDSYEIWQKCRNDLEFKINFHNKLFKHFQDYEAKRKCKRVFNVKVGSDWIFKLKRNNTRICEDQKQAKQFNLADAETVVKRFTHYGAEIIEI
jgi:hypothetical protein